MRIPKLCRQKTRNRAFVIKDGKKIYLGKWGSKDAAEAYQRYIHALTAGTPDEFEERNGEAILSELIAAFFEAKKNYYVKGGKQTRQLARFKAAVRIPLQLYGNTPAKEFGAKRLKICRDEMEASGRYARSYVNTLTTCIRAIFRWGIGEELVSPDTLTALQCVAPLKRGRSIARETRPVESVAPEIVEATMRRTSPIIAAMIAIQRYTGMRPGEVCSMRVRNVDARGDVWTYTLDHDKTDYRRAPSEKKKIPIGPRAQAVLTPYLIEKENEPDAFVFSPIDAARDQAIERRRARKTPIYPSTLQRDAERKERGRKRPLSDHYDEAAYARAITRAAKAAGVAHWTPNQLRHLYATEIRALLGLEAAQLMLGHKRADVTQIYAERDFNKAVEIARSQG